MANVSDLVAPLQLMCRMVGPAQAQLALVEAMKKFMIDTGIFNDHAQMEYQAGVPEYIIDIPMSRIIVSVVNVSVNGVPTTQWARDGIYNNIRLFEEYDDRSCIDVEYTWAINGVDDCEIPDEFLSRFQMPILDGARMYLHRMYGSQMIDPTVAMLAQREFENAIADTKARRIMNFSNSRPVLRSGKMRRRSRASARRFL